MGFFKGCRKWSTLGFNIIFLIIGATLITLGAIYRANWSQIDKAIPPSYHYFESISIIIIVLGTILSLSCLIGTWGLFRKNSYFLTANSVILLTIFVVQIILSIVTFVQMSNKESLAVDVNKTIDDLFTRESLEDKELIDFIQKKFECCGTYGPNFWKEKVKEVPESCCGGGDCTKTMYENGCQNEFYNSLLNTIQIVGITILVFSAVQVIGAAFSMSLANAIRNHNRKYQYYTK